MSNDKKTPQYILPVWYNKGGATVTNYDKKDFTFSIREEQYNSRIEEIIKPYYVKAIQRLKELNSDFKTKSFIDQKDPERFIDEIELHLANEYNKLIGQSKVYEIYESVKQQSVDIIQGNIPVADKLNMFQTLINNNYQLLNNLTDNGFVDLADVKVKFNKYIESLRQNIAEKQKTTEEIEKSLAGAISTYVMTAIGEVVSVADKEIQKVFQFKPTGTKSVKDKQQIIASKTKVDLAGLYEIVIDETKFKTDVNISIKDVQPTPSKPVKKTSSHKSSIHFHSTTNIERLLQQKSTFDKMKLLNILAFENSKDANFKAARRDLTASCLIEIVAGSGGRIGGDMALFDLNNVFLFKGKAYPMGKILKAMAADILRQTKGSLNTSFSLTYQQVGRQEINDYLGTKPDMNLAKQRTGITASYINPTIDIRATRRYIENLVASQQVPSIGTIKMP